MHFGNMDISKVVMGAAQGVAGAVMRTGGAAGKMAAGTQGFAATLKQHMEEEAERRKQAEEGAAGLVSNALILPILKQVRRSPFAENTPFSPGNGEKTFGPQFDMQIADRIAHSPRLGIKNALAERMMKATKPAAKGHGLNVNG